MGGDRAAHGVLYQVYQMINLVTTLYRPHYLETVAGGWSLLSALAALMLLFLISYGLE